MSANMLLQPGFISMICTSELQPFLKVDSHVLDAISLFACLS